ncbi:MAG TPA: HAD hydrolase family protein [Candidatus Thermoplasmatota archaeon]|nr:HAD hydrolase family protein [Candidatus Thermoplasmatota archaeon]
MPSREILALATDYDRTLTDLELRPVPEVFDALARARAAGRKVIIVSGRGLDFLEREVGHLADAIVGENGCFLLHGGSRVCLAPTMELRRVLTALDIPVELGEAMASADVEHEAMLRDAFANAGIDVDLIRNRDRVMVLPRGIDKAAGVLAALDALRIPPEKAAAAGDGENDVVLLQAVGYGIAVSNAVDELKEVADHVSDEVGGHGVARWINEHWLARNKEAAA